MPTKMMYNLRTGKRELVTYKYSDIILHPIKRKITPKKDKKQY